MAENDVHNALMAFQSAFYNRKMINVVQTTCRATHAKNQELSGTIANLEQQRLDLRERVAELKAELSGAKKKLKEEADQLARTQEVCNTLFDALKRSDEKISELISLATNIVAYATSRGKISGMCEPPTLQSIEEEERQLETLYHVHPNLSVLMLRSVR
ncbi:uncharacterized protein LOC141600037 isoform X2 [Silene latifolia]|uniref:uncharacterized protein LOC141600037 isoform X2 n=1 Tax=Silene latifolia TaxID=37657 RepID=UPI003D77C948